VSSDWLIRQESNTDVDEVRDLLRATFPTAGEAKLVDTLRKVSRESFALVAMLDGHVIGHIMFSPVTFEPSWSGATAFGLAPLAVSKAHRKLGVGAALVREGLAACADHAAQLVVVLGDPTYYHRFGFETARPSGLFNEYGVNDPFMVRWLAGKPPRDERPRLVKYHRAFADL